MPSRGGRGAIFVSGNSKCIRTSEWDRGVNFQFPLREHRGYIQRSSFLLKVRNQLSNLAGSLASALRRGRHPPLTVILNV